MKVLPILQIISILYFIFALRMRMWKVSLNSFVVIATVFIIATTHEFKMFQGIWVNYHLPIIVIMMTFIMARVTWQSVNSKLHRKCGGRRLDDRFDNEI